MRDKILETHLQTRKKHVLIGLILAVLGIATIMITLNFGAMELGAGKSISILWAKITDNTELISKFKANEIAVVWNIRLPRILCAFFVGFGLAVAGTIFQSLLRNPLADPYTLGVSSGAAFGASLAIYLNIFYGSMFSTVTFSFLFSIITLIMVIFIAQKGGGMYSSSLVIGGIIVSSVLSSGISVIKMLAGESVSAIVFWLMGSFSGKTWKEVALLISTVPLCVIIAWVYANDLDIMALGEDTARGLGVNTKRIRFLYLILGAIITAVCVAISGIIGFVGLVIPHLLRFWVTSSNRSLIPLSALMGGFMLLIADNITRLFTAGEVPVGVLTTLLGGPFFIYVFLRKPKEGRGHE